MLTKVLLVEKLDVCRRPIRMASHPMPEWRGSLLGNRSLQMGTDKPTEENRTGWIRKESDLIR